MTTKRKQSQATSRDGINFVRQLVLCVLKKVIYDFRKVCLKIEQLESQIVTYVQFTTLIGRNKTVVPTY